MSERGAENKEFRAIEQVSQTNFAGFIFENFPARILPSPAFEPVTITVFPERSTNVSGRVVFEPFTVCQASLRLGMEIETQKSRIRYEAIQM